MKKQLNVFEVLLHLGIDTNKFKGELRMKKIKVISNGVAIIADLLKEETVGNHFVKMMKSVEKGFGIYSTVTKKTYWGYTEGGADVAFAEWVKRFKALKKV